MVAAAGMAMVAAGLVAAAAQLQQQRRLWGRKMDLIRESALIREPEYLLIPPSARLDADRVRLVYIGHLVRQVLPTGPPRWWALNASRCLLNRQKEKHSVASRNFSHIVS